MVDSCRGGTVAGWVGACRLAAGNWPDRELQSGNEWSVPCRRFEPRSAGVGEREADRFWQGGALLKDKSPRGYVLGGIDYGRFRLYGLSILWRMGASRLPVFSAVKLGPHQEHLRGALLREDPLCETQYPFFRRLSQ